MTRDYLDPKKKKEDKRGVSHGAQIFRRLAANCGVKGDREGALAAALIRPLTLRVGRAPCPFSLSTTGYYGNTVLADCTPDTTATTFNGFQVKRRMPARKNAKGS